MSLFDDLFAESAAPMLLEQFGEQVVYYPLNGTPRTIIGIVNRPGNKPFPETPDVGGDCLSIDVLTDPSDPTFGGIAENEIDTGGDELEAPVRRGTEPTKLPARNIASTSGGMMRIELQ